MKARYAGPTRKFPDLGIVEAGQDHEIPKLSAVWVPLEPEKLTTDELASYLAQIGVTPPEKATKKQLVELTPTPPAEYQPPADSTQEN